jgi:hypothetical protein
MVCSLPGSGVPFLRLAAYSVPCHLICINSYGFNRVDFYFAMELQSSVYGGLGMVLRWKVFKICQSDAKWTSSSPKRFPLKRCQHTPETAFFFFNRVRRTCEACFSESPQ